ncbi:DUF1829 domain-containing protein [Enterococcus gallinarum]|nr:DUF1829 domain-containing protein [Enterococcus gallinarum]
MIIQKNLKKYQVSQLLVNHNLAQNRFWIHNSRRNKLVKVHNSLRRNTIESAIATLVDTAEYRQKYYQEAASLNLLIGDLDVSKSATLNNIESLKEYNIDVIDFKNKKK